jgi:hypothetical protein
MYKLSDSKVTEWVKAYECAKSICDGTNSQFKNAIASTVKNSAVVTAQAIVNNDNAYLNGTLSDAQFIAITRFPAKLSAQFNSAIAKTTKNSNSKELAYQARIESMRILKGDAYVTAWMEKENTKLAVMRGYVKSEAIGDDVTE